jgi:hypothetical protein
LRLATTWSIALADAVASRLREGGPDVVRYPSRFAALVEMVCAAARGDFERAWAWRSLGIWRAGDTIEVATGRGEAVAQLVRDARIAPAVLAAAARRGILPLLVTRVPAERWIRLARAALTASSVSGGRLVELWLGGGPAESDALDAPAWSATAAASTRIERTSAIVRHVTSATAVRPVEPATARALAVLAILECEPALAATTHVHEIVDRLARRLISPVVEPAVPRPPHRPGQNEPRRPPSSPRDAQDRFDVPDREPADNRVSATTEFAGLLFLLHLVRALDLPASLLRDPALSARSLPWTLYRIAVLLMPHVDNDAAALAFAGLPPLTPSPVAKESPSTSDEDAALCDARDMMVSALRARMDAAAEETDPELLHRVIGRRAEIVADPGWIELRLAVADVSTDVRRAGLDLDPGWLPWLGIVVWFVYA